MIIITIIIIIIILFLVQPLFTSAAVPSRDFIRYLLDRDDDDVCMMGVVYDRFHRDSLKHYSPRVIDTSHLPPQGLLVFVH